jgi:tripartite-type tricarboxylate transporter receptor subunit TctC
MQRRTFVAATAASAAVLAAPMIKAQTLPNGPVRIVVGFAPGGGTDVLARIVGQKLQAMWNLTVVVENKAGASGVIAADLVSKAAPDGNTLLMAHINSHALAPGLMPKLGYVVERDFTPLTLVGVTPNLLIANVDLPAKTVADVVAH